MRSIKVLIAFLFITNFFNINAFARIQLSPDADISLLTCGPGEELYSVFGHTALRVQDSNSNIDTVYNFGTFDFDTPNFYLKFVKGDLRYFVSVSSYEEFIQQYMYYNRDVFEQALNLDVIQKQRIFDELNSRLLSDRKYYTYKFIDRNCTTMVADIINANIDGNISLKNSDNGKTNREIIYSYLNNKFFENLGINLMFGYKTDKLSDKLFLPKELMEGVSNTLLETAPLSKPAMTIFKANQIERVTSFWNSYYFFAAIILLLILFSAKKIVYVPYLAIAGMLGIFFLTVGYFSYHDEISQNYNALLFNPLFLLLLFFMIKAKRKATTITIYICLSGLFLYILWMYNKPHMLMVVPLIAIKAVILIRLLLLNTKHKTTIV